MIIPDTNLLLYAYVPSFAEHPAAKSWFEDSLQKGDETIGLAWQVITSYIRIGTNPKIFQKPITLDEIDRHLTKLLNHPLVRTVNPQSKHLRIYMDLIKTEQVTADLVIDAHLAALAIEYKAKLATTDRDFTRFSNLNFFNPINVRI